ncbi:MOSC domain-containing protein [Sphingobium lignivorans]|uniref:MOSC domain-containing protein YiiM n=1 Tax=Sphingobium lignivorans TaxID=2735886 RepID=A0ABR6NFN2_9SPHN|nr:MOSC domain-containing protein [Sphingobium lignivorans]MBB5986084.1 MOSC domain-containing protein YiiM [Sphingobium lignivorans]
MALPSLSLGLDAVLTGRPALLAPGVTSAMGKVPVAGPVRIGWLGLEGDTVADPVHHGGHDKAVHLVPQEHYGWWREAIGSHDLLTRPGAFGENLATRGATEVDLCLGDRFELGTSLLEISHGRQPCSKLNHRFGRNDVLAKAVASGRCGLYLRVLREGDVQAGEPMTLVARPHPDWPVARIFALLIGGGHKRDPAGVAALARMPVLAEAWRGRAEALAR